MNTKTRLIIMSLGLLAWNGAFAQTATSAAKPALGAIDTYFVTQTSLGTPFQVDAGRVAEKKSHRADIKSYAKLMVSSHIEVDDALDAILKKKGEFPPPTLLKAAYTSTLYSFKRESDRDFDIDFINGQLNYQHANAALYQYEIDHGVDPDLKAFAQSTLPKIVDHMDKAEKIAASMGIVDTADQKR